MSAPGLSCLPSPTNILFSPPALPPLQCQAQVDTAQFCLQTRSDSLQSQALFSVRKDRGELLIGAFLGLHWKQLSFQSFKLSCLIPSSFLCLKLAFVCLCIQRRGERLGVWMQPIKLLCSGCGNGKWIC